MADTQPLVLAPNVLVLVRADGIQIQRPVMAAPFHLGLAELHLLVALLGQPSADPTAAREEAAGRAGVDPDTLRGVVFDLRLSKDLQPGEVWHHRPAADHPAAASAEPLDIATDDVVSVRVPLTLRVGPEGYEVFDHDGLRWLLLDAAEARFLSLLAQPVTPHAAIRAAAAEPAGAIAEDRAAEILGRLQAAGLLRRGPARAPEGPGLDTSSDEALAFDRDAALAERFRAHFVEQNEREEARRRDTGQVRPRVVPVAFDLGVPACATMRFNRARRRAER